MKENKKKQSKNTLKTISSIFLIITMITTLLSFFIIVITNLNNLKENIFVFLSTFIITIFSICFVLVSINNKTVNHKLLIISSILLILFNMINLFNNTSFALEQKLVKDFTNEKITNVLSWGLEHNIEIIQTYDNSETIPEYHVITQDVKAGTPIDNISTINLVVSEGPNYDKEVIIPNLLGKTYDEVLKIIDENKLNNVNIEFIISDEEKDTVIEQSKSGQMKRSTALKIVFSIGSKDNITPFNIKDLTNESLFLATSYLKRHGIKYELKYEFDDNINKNHVISQDKEKNTLLDPFTDTVTLTISKGKKIIVPDIYNMDNTSLTNWIIEQKLNVLFTDEYSDSVKPGYVINSSVKEGDTLAVGDTVKFTISKGSLKMPKFSTLDDFTTWAEKYNIKYKVEEEFNDTIKSGKIIKFSHKENQVIKNDDTITVYISIGKSVVVPNFIGMNKTDINTKCKSLNITCSFSYGDYSDTIKKDIATKQSKSASSKVSENSTINIILSKGPAKKVTVPNFIGKSKSSIISTCKSLGLNYKFVTGDYSSTYDKDVAYKQSVAKDKEVIEGTTITFTLSKGEKASYNVVIQSNWFVIGNSSSSISSMKSKLSSLYPKLTFKFETVSSDGLTSGIIHPDSKYKADTKYTMTEGVTYTIKVVK